MKFILTYLIALQSASLLSTALVCICFFIMKYLFHMTTKKWIQFFSTYQMSKISFIMIAAELISLFIIVPIAYHYFYTIQVDYLEIIILSIILYTMIPLVFKIRAIKKMLQEGEEEGTGQEIYF